MGGGWGGGQGNCPVQPQKGGEGNLHHFVKGEGNRHRQTSLTKGGTRQKMRKARPKLGGGEKKNHSHVMRD